MKKYYKLIIVILILIICVTSGYAYFIAEISNNNAVTTDVSTNEFKIAFADSAEISAEGILPGAKIVKKFTITNDGNNTLTFDINLINVINQIADNGTLKYDIDCETGVSTSGIFPTSDASLIENVGIAPHSTQNYTLTIEFVNTDYSQNEDMNKAISGVLQIENVGSLESLVYDNTISEGLIGKGTISEPYLIYNGADLMYFRNQVNNEGTITGLNTDLTNNNENLTAASASYLLMNNIILNDPNTTLNYDTNNIVEWTPIGYNDNAVITEKVNNAEEFNTLSEQYTIFYYRSRTSMSRLYEYSEYQSQVYASFSGTSIFTGNFNGGGFTISGLYTNFGDLGANVGLFGAIGGNATIKNITLDKSFIYGINNAGGIVGYVASNSNVTIAKVKNNANVTSEYSTAGGIIASASGVDNLTISNAINNGPVYAKDTVGGIVGKVYINSANNSVIINSANTGLITGTNTTSASTGGIVGKATNINIKSSKNTGELSCSNYYCGGIAGSLTASQINDSYNTGFISAYWYIGGMAGVTDSNSTITNVYNTGKIQSYYNYSTLGGIVGQSQSVITNAYNIGIIENRASNNGYIGGIVGNNMANLINVNNSGSYYASYSSTKKGAIMGGQTIGSVSGYYVVNQYPSISGDNTPTEDTTTAVPLEAMPLILNVVNGNNAFKNDSNNINNGYPLLGWE